MTKTRELKASSSHRPALSPPHSILNLNLVPSVFRLSFSVLVGYLGSISAPPGHAISRPIRGDGNGAHREISSPLSLWMLLPTGQLGLTLISTCDLANRTMVRTG